MAGAGMFLLLLIWSRPRARPAGRVVRPRRRAGAPDRTGLPSTRTSPCPRRFARIWKAVDPSRLADLPTRAELPTRSCRGGHSSTPSTDYTNMATERNRTRTSGAGGEHRPAITAEVGAPTSFAGDDRDAAHPRCSGAVTCWSRVCPASAKTTLVKAFFRTLGCSFKRIQVHPRPLAVGHHGTYILDMRTNSFRAAGGPIFANVGPRRRDQPRPRQDAVCPAGSDAGAAGDDRGGTRPLQAPFLVLARRTHRARGHLPAPEAQVDSLLVKVNMHYQARRREADARHLQPPRGGGTAGARPETSSTCRASPRRCTSRRTSSTTSSALVTFTRKHRRVHLAASPRRRWPAAGRQGARPRQGAGLVLPTT